MVLDSLHGRIESMMLFSSWPRLHPRFHHHNLSESPEHVVSVNIDKLLRILNSAVFLMTIAATVLEMSGATRLSMLGAVNGVSVVFIMLLLLFVELPCYELPQVHHFVRIHVGFLAFPFGRVLLAFYVSMFLSAMRGTEKTFFGFVAGVSLIVVSILDMWAYYALPHEANPAELSRISTQEV